MALAGIWSGLLNHTGHERSCNAAAMTRKKEASSQEASGQLVPREEETACALARGCKAPCLLEQAVKLTAHLVLGRN